MTKKVATQGKKWREVASKVSDLCNRFYAMAGTDRFLEYLLVVLFWKYVSDCWKEEVEHSSEALTGVDKRLNLASARFFVLPGASFYDVLEHCGDSDLGVHINQALLKLSVANSHSLRGLFESFDFTSEEEIGPRIQQASILSTLLESLNDSSLDLRPSQIVDVDVGEMIILLLSLFFSGFGRKSNKSYTNDDIATLMAKLSRPENGDTILDPVCGTGSLLIRTSQEVERGDCYLYGQEKNPTTHAIARINLLFHGLDDAKIQVGDCMIESVRGKFNRFKQYDRIVASPPLEGFHMGLAAAGSTFSFPGEDATPWGEITFGANGYVKFLDLLIRLAKPKIGKVVVTVPSGILFRGKDEWLFRRLLIRENILDAVINLPDGKIAGGPSSAILVIDRSREKGGENFGSRNVMFIDAKERFNRYNQENKGDYSHVAAIMSGYQNRTSQPEFAYNARLDEIERNGYDLTTSKYTQQAQNEQKDTIKKVEAKMKPLRMEITKLDSEIDRNMARLQNSQFDK